MIKTHDGTQSRRIVAVGDRYPSQGFQRPRTQITAVGGETSITLPANLSYKPGLNQITVKRSSGGSLLAGLDFFETSTTTIGFPTTDPLQAGEIIEVTLEAVTTGIAAIAPRPDCYTATATASQTVITSSFSWPYNLNAGKAIGGVSLYINGVLQTRGVDYVEVNLSLANTNQVDVTLGGALVGGENIVLVPTYQVIDDAGASTQFNNSRFGSLLTDPASVVAVASVGNSGIVNNTAGNTAGTPIKGKADGLSIDSSYIGATWTDVYTGVHGSASTTWYSAVSRSVTAGKYKVSAMVVGLSGGATAFSVALVTSASISDGGFDYSVKSDGFNSMGTDVNTVAKCLPDIYINVPVGGSIIYGQVYCVYSSNPTYRVTLRITRVA